MRLADGGITDNLPVQVAQDEHANIVIAADCTSELRAPDDINAPGSCRSGDIHHDEKLTKAERR